jgi:hypothetical protein
LHGVNYEIYGFVIRHPAYLGLSWAELSLRLLEVSNNQVLLVGAQIDGQPVLNPGNTFMSSFECVCFALAYDQKVLVPLELEIDDGIVLADFDKRFHDEKQKQRFENWSNGVLQHIVWGHEEVILNLEENFEL